VVETPPAKTASGAGGMSASVQVVAEDPNQEPDWIRDGRRGLFGAHWTFTLGLAIIALVAVTIAGFDIQVAQEHGLMLLDITLEAQAEAVLAIVAVIGGSYAVYRLLTPGARDP
jgi:hypothetical protein